MGTISREEQRKAAQERALQNYENRNDGGSSGKRVIDLSKIGGYKKELFYKPKEGVNHIDILPYVIKTDRHPQRLRIGYTDYLLDLWVHRRVGPSESTFLCLKKMYGKACPICEELDELRKNSDVSDEVINSMRAKRRCWYNVINLDVPERDQKVQIFEEAHWLFEKELLEKAGIKKDGFVTFWDIEEGKSIIFRANQKKSNKGNFFEYRIDDFESREPYSEKIFEETYALDELLVVPTYDEVRNAFNGISETQEKPSEKETKRNENDEGLREGRRSRFRKEEPEEAPHEGRRRNRDEKRDERVNKCPYNHVYGVDNDEFKECAECDKNTWNACADEHDALEK